MIFRRTLVRGDSVSFPVALPTSVYSAGGNLFFAMKAATDDDVHDYMAVITKTFTDADIASQNATTVNYTLEFLPSDTYELLGEFLAEFEWVSVDGATVVSWPGSGDVWKVTVVADVNRRVS